MSTHSEQTSEYQIHIQQQAKRIKIHKQQETRQENEWTQEHQLASSVEDNELSKFSLPCSASPITKQTRSRSNSFTTASSCLSLVFEYLDFQSLLHCSTVCKEWKNVQCRKESWKSVRWKVNRWKITDQQWVKKQFNVNTVKHLTVLHLVKCYSLSAEAFANFLPLSSLISVNLSFSSVNDDNLQSIVTCWPSLQSLKLHYCQHITDIGIRKLSQHRSLTALDCSMCRKITDSGCYSIGQINNLRSLNLSGCYITDVGIDYLKELPLRKLVLKECYNLTDVALHSLVDMKLQHLVISYTSITDASAPYFLRMSTLRYLSVRGCSHLTDVTLTTLLPMNWLIEFNTFACSTMTNEGRKQWKKTNPHCTMWR